MANKNITQKKMGIVTTLLLVCFGFILLFFMSSRIMLGDQPAETTLPASPPVTDSDNDNKNSVSAINLSFTTGNQGSDFIGSCENFPTNTTVDIYITFPNGEMLRLGSKETDAIGACNFILDTSQKCLLGEYTVTASGGGTIQTAIFTIDSSFPTRVAADSNANIVGGSGGGENKIYIPIIR